jgi:hypothetical protein
VAQVASVATPPATSSPLSASHSTLGCAPTPTTTMSAGRRVPSSRSTAWTRSGADQPATPTPVQQADAVVGVQRAADGAHHGAQRAGERGRHGLDDRHDEPARPGGGGHLRTDEAAADHHEAPAGSQVVAQGDRVVQRAQHVDAGERLGAGQLPGTRAGRRGRRRRR